MGTHETHRPEDLARLIDHTLLRADATRTEILALCAEAIRWGFFSACVNSAWVEVAAEAVQGSSVKVVSVVGFPLGASVTQAKVFEATEAVRRGAQEIDMVQNVGALKGAEDEWVRADIQAVVQAVVPVPVKVILETSLLSQEEKVRAAEIAKSAGAAFVKTSTGFSSGGATVEDVALLRRVVGPTMGVKASGKIRTADEAWVMVRAGASRIGASASVALVQGKKADLGY